MGREWRCRHHLQRSVLPCFISRDKRATRTQNQCHTHIHRYTHTHTHPPSHTHTTHPHHHTHTHPHTDTHTISYIDTVPSLASLYATFLAPLAVSIKEESCCVYCCVW